MSSKNMTVEKMIRVSMSKKLTLSLVITAVFHTGCAPLVIGTGIETALVARDPRTSGTQLEDQLIAQRFSNRLSQAFKNNDAIHVNATSYNRRLLLTGEVPDQNTSLQIAEIARKTDNVEHVFNELAIRLPSSFSDRSSDALLTAKVKSTLLVNAPTLTDSLKLMTESGVVYLLGLATKEVTQEAVDHIRKISGVKRVVILVERNNG